jgi:hypothetical protein
MVGVCVPKVVALGRRRLLRLRTSENQVSLVDPAFIVSLWPDSLGKAIVMMAGGFVVQTIHEVQEVELAWRDAVGGEVNP